MAFDITQFKSALVWGGARPSLFECSLSFPTGFPLSIVSEDGVSGVLPVGTAAERLTFMAKASSIPASTISPIEVPYFGRKVKFAGNRTFPEWTITVINDENFLVRRAFEAWLAAINTHKSNLKKFPGSTYMTQGTVKQYGKQGGNASSSVGANIPPIRQYNFYNVFPSEVSPIELNWGSENEIEEFTVTLQYDYWTADEPLGSGGGNNSGNTGSGGSGGGTGGGGDVGGGLTNI